MSEWISVKDRLPEHTDPVLGLEIDYNIYSLVERVHFKNGKSKWRCCAGRGFWSVDFWQPLPQPPKDSAP